MKNWDVEIYNGRNFLITVSANTPGEALTKAIIELVSTEGSKAEKTISGFRVSKREEN